jgi:hypothetical protein
MLNDNQYSSYKGYLGYLAQFGPQKEQIKMTQNIIDFKDIKYVKENIPGKGECLVPYREPWVKWNDIKEGDYFTWRDKRNPSSFHNNKYVFLKCTHGPFNAIGTTAMNSPDKAGLRVKFSNLDSNYEYRIVNDDDNSGFKL